MQTPQRRIDTGVIGRLLEEPYRFGFFQAVRLLELWFSRQDSVRAEDIVAQCLSFRNTLSLAFPPSEIHAIDAHSGDGAKLLDAIQRAAAIADGSLDQVHITPAFFGLLGGQGALPLHYTEQIAEREYSKRDRAAREFFDIFSNRATALFYAAWKKYRLPFQYETDRDERYLPLLLSLAGIGDAQSRGDLHTGAGSLYDESLAGYAGAARHKPVSAVFLQNALTDYFSVPIVVQQFIGKWYDVPPDQLTTLSGVNATLGATALAGARIWQRDMRARLLIGPLAKADYDMFLPGAERALALERMLTVLAGITLEYEVVLILRRADVGFSQLSAGARLGWDAFLSTRDSVIDRTDSCYELHVIH
jgi:type VI secretion system protein ImpH